MKKILIVLAAALLGLSATAQRNRGWAAGFDMGFSYKTSSYDWYRNGVFPGVNVSYTFNFLRLSVAPQAGLTYAYVQKEKDLLGATGHYYGHDNALLFNAGVDLRLQIAGPVCLSAGPHGFVRLFHKGYRGMDDTRGNLGLRVGPGVTLGRFYVTAGYQFNLTPTGDDKYKGWFMPLYAGVKYYF